MFAEILNVILGLVFVYLAFALLTSRINEFVANLLQWRAQGLNKGLTALVGGPALAPPSVRERIGLPSRPGTPGAAVIPGTEATPPLLSAAKIKQHPLVAASDAAIEGKRVASYLSGQTFAAAVVDILSSASPVVPPASASAPTDVATVAPALQRVEKQHLNQAGRDAYVRLLREPSGANLRAFADALHPGDVANFAIIGELNAFIPSTLDRVRASLAQLKADNSPAAEAVRSLLASAGGDLDSLLSRLGTWFDTQMERVGGSYKRRVQRWILAYAVLLVLLFNVDTVGIAKDLWLSPVHRAAVAEVAAKAAAKDLDSVTSEIDDVPGLALPLGWDLSPRPASATGAPTGTVAATTLDDDRRLPGTPSGWLLKVIGLFLSAIAINFGAPFWFDALGKLANVRNAGKRPAETT